MKGRKARKDNLFSLNTQIQTQTIIVIHYLRKSKMCGFPLAEERKKRKTFFSHTAGSMGSRERGGSSGHMVFQISVVFFRPPFSFFPPRPPFRAPFTFLSSPLRTWNRLGPKRGNRRIRCEKEKVSLFRELFTLRRLSI